jgi:hypothetical protein
MKIHTLTRSWWRDASIAGATGAAVMLLYSLLVVGSVTELFWLPLTTLATGTPFLPVPGGSWVPVLLGTVIHLMIGAALGLVSGAFMSVLTRSSDERMHRSWLVGGLVGLAFGVAVYLVMGLLIGNRVDTGIRILNQTSFFIGHLFYGLTTGLMLTSLTRNTRRATYGVTMAPEVSVREETFR